MLADVKVVIAVAWKLTDSAESKMKLTVEFDSVDPAEARTAELIVCSQIVSAEY